ncbi:MAG: cyclic nucleotide-binding domain-containing protein [Leptolyngbya sp. SIO4C5]|uniref:cyclic nucleotide-binding domain-containing protein n=1 Tax=Sphaerothrix gracilis TaxID=3151835 RepID=UPI0013BF72DC|nr:cyclic nucleotide-binding domain-containing protein [Leptolyngbya sp. SIO4C5]
MPVAFNALLQGLLGASSLLIGGLLGAYWQPSRVFSAAIMAFGSGTLLSAIAFDISLPVYQLSGFWPLLVGFLIGGTLFTAVISYIDQQGGFLRHPSSSRRFLYHQRQEETSEILDRISHVEILHTLSPAEMQAIIPLLKPLSVEAGTLICQEGAPGDALFLIVTGEAQIIKGQQLLALLGPGEMFGEMALLTGEERSASVVAGTSMELYELDKVDFDAMLERSPQLASGLSRILARRLRDTTQTTLRSLETDGTWRRQVLDSVEIDLPLPEQQAMLLQLTKNTAPLAILVGTLIDNIPESAVLGLTANSYEMGGSFLMAVFISNIPEALSSSTGMRQAGTSVGRILTLWIGAVVLSGLMALLGSLLSSVASNLVIAIAQSIAGGAILAMLASTMMPEAYELGGGSVTFSTITGFLMGVWVASPSL